MKLRRTLLPERMEIIIVIILYSMWIAGLLLSAFFLIYLAVLRPSSDAALINYVALEVLVLIVGVPTAIWATMELTRRLQHGKEPNIPRPTVKDLQEKY